MIEVTLTNRDVTATGLYLMRWNKRTGLVRVVGQPKTGWRLLPVTDMSVECLMSGLPADGVIPADALLSEPLALTVEKTF
jgi:hypothetical protein